MWQSNIHVLTTSSAFQEAVKAQSDHKHLRHILQGTETYVQAIRTAGVKRQKQQISHQINVYGHWSRGVWHGRNEALYIDPFCQDASYENAGLFERSYG